MIPHAEEKMEMMGFTADATTRMIVIHAGLFDKKIEDSLSYLRFLAYDGDLSLFRDNESLWELKNGKRVMHGRGIVPISLENERTVFAMLLELIKLAMTNYTCPPSDDYKLLQDPKLTFNQRNIVLIRLEEKETLSYWMQLSTAITNILGMTFE